MSGQKIKVSITTSKHHAAVAVAWMDAVVQYMPRSTCILLQVLLPATHIRVEENDIQSSK